MADQEVATKAPESDAAEQSDPVEQSVFPGDSKPDQGPSLGEHCTTDRPTPQGEVPTGEISKLGDVDVYITKPSDYPHAPSRLLLFLTGGTGIKSANNQIQADKYAAEGYLVVMPDQFEGDPAPNTETSFAESEPSLIEQLKLRAAETAKSFLIDMWLARHTSEKVLPLLRNVIDNAKEEFADAVANGGGIYAVGYCFGAKYAMILAGDGGLEAGERKDPSTDVEQAAAKSPPLVKAAAVAHATLVTKEDLDLIRAPISLACVEDDGLFPNDILEAGRTSLEKNKVDHEIQVYSGMPHGFAVLGDYEDSKIKESQKQAFTQMLAWLQAH